MPLDDRSHHRRELHRLPPAEHRADGAGLAAAFPISEDDKKINTAHLHGVTLAAIQGLGEQIKLRDAAIDELKAELHALREEVRSNLPPAE